MYIPSRYRITDDAVIDEFIRTNGFGLLVTAGPGELMGTHLPVELAHGDDGARLLRGHVSKANAQWREFGADREALIVLLGPHTYITPTWYDHANVPTWNYQAVHAYGPLRAVPARDDMLASVRQLSEHYEPAAQPPPRFDVDAMPEALREAELKGIVCFEMRVSRVEAAFKLSQNRHDHDHARIIRELDARGDQDSRRVAQAMREHR